MLYIVPTPIGNLQDITLRALETLKTADAVLCEDTRRTQILLSHFGISKPLYRYNENDDRSVLRWQTALRFRLCRGLARWRVPWPVRGLRAERLPFWAFCRASRVRPLNYFRRHIAKITRWYCMNLPIVW